MAVLHSFATLVLESPLLSADDCTCFSVQIREQHRRTARDWLETTTVLQDSLSKNYHLHTVCTGSKTKLVIHSVTVIDSAGLGILVALITSDLVSYGESSVINISMI